MSKEVQNVELEGLLAKFVEINATKKAAEKELEKLKPIVKKAITESGEDEIILGDYKAKLNVQDRSTMDQDAIVEVLERLGFLDAIDTVKVPNESKVETLVYDGKIDAAEFEVCRRPKFVEVLSVTGGKKKGGK